MASSDAETTWPFVKNVIILVVMDNTSLTEDQIAIVRFIIDDCRIHGITDVAEIRANVRYPDLAARFEEYRSKYDKVLVVGSSDRFFLHETHALVGRLYNIPVVFHEPTWDRMVAKESRGASSQPPAWTDHNHENHQRRRKMASFAIGIAPETVAPSIGRVGLTSSRFYGSDVGILNSPPIWRTGTGVVYVGADDYYPIINIGSEVSVFSGTLSIFNAQWKKFEDQWEREVGAFEVIEPDLTELLAALRSDS